MLKSLFQFGQSKSILVCETDGFLLRGSVLTKVGNDVTVLQTAESQEADMAEAVADLIKQLKTAGWEGTQAILLSPTVLSTNIELPVNPKKPRPLVQMNELVRWEAEPLLMQHTTQWSVGNLLIARGYMTKEQSDSVMDLQQGRANPAGGMELSEKFSLRRFGDLAEELGFIKRSQLNACLAGQEWLKSDDENIECGWSAQTEVSDIPGTYNWQVSAVSKSLLQRWTKVFQMQGVTLQAMYPLIGSSTCLLPKSNDDQILIEYHQGSAFAIYIKDNQIHQQHLYLDPSKQPLSLCLECYHSLSIDSAPRIVLSSCDHDSAQALNNEFSSSIEAEIVTLSHPSTSQKTSPGMLGAAYHYFGVGNTALVCQVRLGGPLPVLSQRVEFRAAILAGLLIFIILASEMGLAIYGGLVKANKAEIDQKWDAIDMATKRIKSDLDAIQQRKAQLGEQEKDRVRQEQIVHFFGKELPNRSALVQTILGLLQASITEDVIINRIDEYGKRVSLMPVLPSAQSSTHVDIENFNIEAWALTESAAQRFIQKLEESANPLGLDVVDSNVISRTGPLDLSGFAVVLRITKSVDKTLLDKVSIL